MFHGSIEKSKIKSALKSRKAHLMKEEIEYIRFSSSFKGIERGTVVLPGGRTIWGFPHIKRIFTIENGIKRNIKEGRVYVEEKIDGFNIRIARIGQEIFAFSRGGFLDSFVTEKVRRMDFGDFFLEHPRYVLCGEMLGNTPYTKPTKKYDVKVFIFDIDNGRGDYLPCKKKYELLKMYDIPSVPVIGRFRSDDFDEFRRIALNINRAKKEGMVIKSESRKEIVKYVNVNADIDDIKNCAKLFFDMPFGFFNQRFLRSAFFIREYALDREKYGKAFGTAYLKGLIRAISIVASGKEIEEEFEICVEDERIWEKIRAHTGKEVRLKLIFKKKEKDKIRIRFSKVYLKTTKLLKAFVHGKGVTD